MREMGYRALALADHETAAGYARLKKAADEAGLETLIGVEISATLPDGRETAQRMYGCRGFVAHHNTDIWGDTAPQDKYLPATYWPMGAAWLCLHIWEHYLFTGDIETLGQYFDCLEEAVVFF